MSLIGYVFISFHHNGLVLVCLILLAQASSFGVEFDLVRISVGLEDVPLLRAKVQQALDAVAKISK